MKRYEKYKPTGIQWLPEIPEHWNIMQLRKYLSLVSIKGKGDKQLLSVTRENGVIERDIYNLEENHNFVPEDLNGYKYVTPGQFVINKMKSWQGSYGVSDYEGIVSPAYFVCDLNFPNKEFFSQAIRSRAYVDFFAQWSKGIRVGQWDLEPIALKSIPFFEPPIPEQNKIVTYLDKRITLIDNCKCQRERELQTLNELKQAEIASVVTRGLNPDVPMKDSGIPWIGQIPVHWDMKYLFQVAHEHYISNKDIHHQNLLSLSYGKIVHKDINTTEGLLPASFDTYQIIEPGNIVFRFTDLQNDHKSLRVGLSKETGIITSAYIAVEVDTIYILPEYFYYTLHSFDIKKLFYSMGGGLRQSLNYNGIRKLYLPIPPLEEQKAIVSFVDNKIKKIEVMIQSLESEIDRLTEYKQRLISDVVTGQIDVRGEQIQ